MGQVFEFLSCFLPTEIVVIVFYLTASHSISCLNVILPHNRVSYGGYYMFVVRQSVRSCADMSSRYVNTSLSVIHRKTLLVVAMFLHVLCFHITININFEGLYLECFFLQRDGM